MDFGGNKLVNYEQFEKKVRPIFKSSLLYFAKATSMNYQLPSYIVQYV